MIVEKYDVLFGQSPRGIFHSSVYIDTVIFTLLGGAGVLKAPLSCLVFIHVCLKQQNIICRKDKLEYKINIEILGEKVF